MHFELSKAVHWLRCLFNSSIRYITETSLFSSLSGNETGSMSRHIGTISVKNPVHAEGDMIPSHHTGSTVPQLSSWGANPNNKIVFFFVPLETWSD